MRVLLLASHSRLRPANLCDAQRHHTRNGREGSANVPHRPRASSAKVPRRFREGSAMSRAPFVTLRVTTLEMSSLFRALSGDPRAMLFGFGVCKRKVR